MTYSAMPQVRRSLIERVRESTVLAARLTGDVHDAVPKTAQKPYAVITTQTETPDDTMGQRGHEVDVSIDIYTDDGSGSRSGRGTSGQVEGEEIAELICAELIDSDTPIVVDGHDVVDMTLIGIRATRVEDTKDTRITRIELTASLEDDLGLA